MQAFGGSISKGEGESIHEIWVDLIQINEIRELPADKQFIFIHGGKPIRGKRFDILRSRVFQENMVKTH